MGFMSSLLNVAQYIPLVMEVTRAFTGNPQEETEHKTAIAAVDDLRHQTEKRLKEQTQEINALRERLRHAENRVTSLLLWVTIGIPALAILMIVLLILVLTRG
jgi:septal ring factor EnvC (AmiA/AmiB activator)